MLRNQKFRLLLNCDVVEPSVMLCPKIFQHINSLFFDRVRPDLPKSYCFFSYIEPERELRRSTLSYGKSFLAKGKEPVNYNFALIGMQVRVRNIVRPGARMN